jgi:hypothetical protein
VTRQKGFGKRLAAGALAGFLTWCFISLAVACTNPRFVDTIPGWLAVALAAAAAGACLALVPLPGRLFFWTWSTVSAVAALALGIAIAARAPDVRPKTHGRQSPLPAPVLVLGLDGATWSVLGPLIQDGRTPHIARLVSQGASGGLTSLEPMASPRLWASIDTGVKPEKHGISSFFSTQADLRTWRIWEWLAVRRGAAVGLMEWYLTWPPPQAAAWSVPGLFAPDEQTKPPRLGFLKAFARSGHVGAARPSVFRLAGLGLDAIAAGMRLSTAFAAGRLFGKRLVGMTADERYVEEHLLWARIKADVFGRLISRSRPDWAALFLNEADVFGHRYFAQSVQRSGGRLSAALADAYRLADRALGVALDAYGARRPVVLIVSDHGFRLAPPGARRFKPNLDKSLRSLLRLDPERFVWTYVGSDLFLRPRSGSDSGALAAARRTLLSLRVQERPLLQVGAIDDGSLLIRLADGLRLDGRTLVQFDGGSVPAKLLLAKTEKDSGVHDITGVIVLSGPGVRHGISLHGASLLDVVPTLFVLAGEPLPEGMAGRVLTEALLPSWLARHPLRRQPPLPPRPRVASPGAPERAIEDQLRTLGYIR